VLRRALGRARPRQDDDRGAVAILVAAMLTVFIGLAALVVDRGLAADTQRQAQNASDASALAAAVVLSRGGSLSDSDAAARTYAQANFGVTAGEWSTCTATLQSGFSALTDTSCISYSPTAHAVRVVLPTRQVSTVFGTIYGVSRRTVAAAATAGFGGPPGSDCLLCVLGTIDGQTGSIEASGGDVAAKNIVNFNNNNGSITATGGQIRYVTWDGSGKLNPAPSPVGAVVDPYAAVTPPALGGTAITPARNTACTQGTYIDVSNCASFAPGLYVIVGNSGNELQVDALGVTFYMTCSDTTGPRNNPVVTARACNPGEQGGSFGGSGNSRVTVKMSGSAAGTYRDMAVFVDRNNAASQRWTGNGELDVTGILYSPNNAGLDDTRGNGNIVVNGRMVVGSIQMRGRGTAKVHISVAGASIQGPPEAALPIPHLSE
jgi:Flp pilus assembly protein TadG